jgi:predicted nucleic acid-binding protein
LIVYLDSSVLVRAYLADEEGHKEAVGLMNDPGVAAVTGTWTRIEVSAALVRAARAGRSHQRRADEEGLLTLLDADIGPEGPVTVLRAPQERVEDEALKIVRAHGLRAMDAWHLAVAKLTLPMLAEPGEEMAFASRDKAQTATAELLGFALR